MHHKKKINAFTLVEVLVVMVLITLIISMVAPKGHKFFNSISNKIEQKELQIKKQNDSYKAFLYDE